MKGDRFSFSLISFALLRIREILTHNWGVVKLFECKEKIKWCWVKSVVIPLSPPDQPSSNTPDKWNVAWPRSIVRSGIRQKTRWIIKCTSGLSSLKKQISRLQDPFASCKLLCATCYVLRHLISIARQLLYSILTPARKVMKSIYTRNLSKTEAPPSEEAAQLTTITSFSSVFFNIAISSLLNWGGKGEVDSIYISWRNAELAFSRNFRSEIAAASLDVKDLIVISLKLKMLRFYISTWDYSLSNAWSSQKAVWGPLAERILVCLGDLNLYNFTSTLPLLM